MSFIKFATGVFVSIFALQCYLSNSTYLLVGTLALYTMYVLIVKDKE